MKFQRPTFLALRALRKGAKLLGYRIDFAPRSVTDDKGEKVLYFKRLWSRVRKLEGDIVECGLGNGFSFAHLSAFGAEAGKRVYGFDSFEGFPALAPEDASSYAVKQGDWGNVDLSMVEGKVLVNVSREYYDRSVRIITGFFSDTLPKTTIGPICFLHLDADLYPSYMDCLKELYAKVVPGGIIAIDEYLNGMEYGKYPGGFYAIRDFFKDREHEVDICRDLITGKYYIIKR